MTSIMRLTICSCVRENWERKGWHNRFKFSVEAQHKWLKVSMSGRNETSTSIATELKFLKIKPRISCFEWPNYKINWIPKLTKYLLIKCWHEREGMGSWNLKLWHMADPDDAENIGMLNSAEPSLLVEVVPQPMPEKANSSLSQKTAWPPMN